MFNLHSGILMLCSSPSSIQQEICMIHFMLKTHKKQLTYQRIIFKKWSWYIKRVDLDL